MDASSHVYIFYIFFSKVYILGLHFLKQIVRMWRQKWGQELCKIGWCNQEKNTWIQHVFFHFLNTCFYIFYTFLEILKNRKKNTSTIFFILSSIITGRSCETCQIYKILTPPRESQILHFHSVFRNGHVFQNIECFVQIIVKKAIFRLEVKLLTLNLTIPCDRITVFKKTCRWSFRPIRYHQKIIT